MVSVTNSVELLVQIQGNIVSVLNIARNFAVLTSNSTMTTNGFYTPFITSLTKRWLILFPITTSSSTLPTNITIQQLVINILAPNSSYAVSLPYSPNLMTLNDS